MIEEGKSTSVSTLQNIDSDLPSHPEMLTSEELDRFVSIIDQSNEILKIENTLLQQYLQRTDSHLIAKMETILEAATTAANKAAGKTSFQASSISLAGRRPTLDSLYSTPRSTATFKSQSALSHKTTGLTTSSDKNLRVQAAQKIEIVNREMEEVRNNLKMFSTRNEYLTKNLIAQDEEFSIRLKENKEAIEYFREKVSIGNKSSGKIPVDKFIRYVEGRLAVYDSQIDKLVLKISQIKVYLNKVEQQLAQKEELGEVLSPIDFEQLEIENRESQEKLDEKIIHLMEVKKINGRCGTVLSFSKKKLQEQLNQLTNLTNTLKLKEEKIKIMEEQKCQVEKEVDKVKKEVEMITEVTKTYQSPHVLDYMEHKTRLQELAKTVLIWRRREYLVKISSEKQSRETRNKLRMAFQKKKGPTPLLQNKSLIN